MQLILVWSTTPLTDATRLAASDGSTVNAAPGNVTRLVGIWMLAGGVMVMEGSGTQVMVAEASAVSD